MLDLKLKDTTNILEPLYATGPGIGIQLESGRLIIPSWYFDERGSHVLYSDDHGLTWKKGGDGNAGAEPQAYQAKNGSVYMNCRSSEGKRVILWSHDEGNTWEDWGFDDELNDFGVMRWEVNFFLA